MATYPPDDRWFVRWARFINILDDNENKLSPTKINVWGANIAGISTAAATIFAWVGAHWQMLDHVMSVAPLVGGYLGHAFTAHHFDKREHNLQAARMKGS